MKTAAPEGWENRVEKEMIFVTNLVELFFPFKFLECILFFLKKN